MTFWNKSFNEWDKIDKPVLVFIDYEGSNDNNIKMVPTNNNVNNCCNMISDSKSEEE